MTDDRTLERAARSWLEEGPTRAPERALDSALSRIQTTRQERDLRIPWRFPTMFTNRMVVAALAIVVIVAAGGLVLTRLTGSSIGGPPATAAPTATPHATLAPPPSATPKPLRMTDATRTLAAGTYRNDDFVVPFTVTLDAGWIERGFQRSDFVLNNNDAFLALVQMNRYYPDPCHTDRAPSVVGPGVDGMIAALSSMKKFKVQDVVETTIGGYLAKSFKLTNTIDLAKDGCTTTDIVWIGRDADDQPVLESAGGPDALRAVEVNGITLLVGGPANVVDTLLFGP